MSGAPKTRTTSVGEALAALKKHRSKEGKGRAAHGKQHVGRRVEVSVSRTEAHQLATGSGARKDRNASVQEPALLDDDDDDDDDDDELNGNGSEETSMAPIQRPNPQTPLQSSAGVIENGPSPDAVTTVMSWAALSWPAAPQGSLDSKSARSVTRTRPALDRVVSGDSVGARNGGGVQEGGDGARGVDSGGGHDDNEGGDGDELDTGSGNSGEDVVHEDEGDSDAEDLAGDVHDGDQQPLQRNVAAMGADRRGWSGSKPRDNVVRYLGYEEKNSIDSYFVYVPKHVEELTGFDVRTLFGFYSLFSNWGPLKLMVNMPDMVMIAGGVPVYWLFTARQGQHRGSVLRKLADKTDPASIRRAFLGSARADELNFEHHVAFLQQDQKEIRIVQQYVKPLKDVGYRTMMTKKGEVMDFSTISFRVSHAYRPLQGQTAVVFPTRKMCAVGARRKEEPEEVLPRPDEAIANECQKVVQSIMRHLARVWQLDLDELVCEFVQTKDHKLVLLRVQRFEWREGQLHSGTAGGSSTRV